MTKAIADAYVEGYKAGYKDREAEIPVDLRDNKTEYIDLGLPSHTLWASDFVKDEDGHFLEIPYCEATRYKIPTKEQWAELLEYCKHSSSSKYFSILGMNGVKLCLTLGSYGLSWTDFWIESETDPKHENLSARIGQHRSLEGNDAAYIHDFTGEHKRILLVK